GGSFSLDLRPDQRAERAAALEVEGDVVQQHQSGADCDDAVRRLRSGERKEAGRVIAALDNEAEHPPAVGVENDVGRTPEQDAVEPDWTSDHAGDGERPHGEILPI